MATINSVYCPKCKKQTELSDRASHGFWRLAECNSCNQFFALLRDNMGNIREIHPSVLPRKVDDRVDEKIYVDLDEAFKCEAAGAYRAAATMARRVLQVIALDKGAPVEKTNSKGKTVKVPLIEQINWLFDNHVITADLKAAAHQVRLLGNAGAHPFSPQNTDKITSQEAEQILGLTEQFVNVLYVVPAITKEMQIPAIEEAAV